MITEQDLQAAIAECQGQRNPNAATCIKLASFLTIKDHMYPSSVDSVEPRLSEYSFAGSSVEETEKTITYNSGSEFSEAVYGKDQNEVMAVMDELMDVLEATNIRLYNGVLRKIRS